MLLQNQNSIGNKHGLGFGKRNVFKNPLNCFEKNGLENLNFENSKGFLKQKQNEKLFYNKPFKHIWIPKGNKTNSVNFKQIWVPKGTKVNSDGLLYKQVWVPKAINIFQSGFTNFVRPLNSLNC